MSKQKRRIGAGIDALFKKPEQVVTPDPNSYEEKAPIISGVKKCCFELDLDVLEKLKAISRWKRQSMRHVLTDSINAYVAGDPNLEEAISDYRKNIES